jgi:hypothetical protein
MYTHPGAGLRPAPGCVKKTHLMKTFTIFLIYLLSPLSVFSSIWYVDQAATGANTGLSWADAFTDLQDALALAQYGDEVWVAKGIYHPTQSGDRQASFFIANGVKWYGGFAGGETGLEQRDWELNPTVLSGEIGDPDLPEDNSLHVVYGTETDSCTRIDGFVITGGYAKPGFGVPQGNKANQGGGVLIWPQLDGWEVQITIANCRVVCNFAELSLGGVGISTGSNKYASPRILNVVFEDNYAYKYSGLGIGDSGAGISRRTEIVGCVFRNNTAEVFFGGLGYYTRDGQEGLLLKDCLFENNYVGGSGGGMGVTNSQVPIPVEIVNCTFTGNTTGNTGGSSAGAISARSDNPTNAYQTLRLENCLFSGNVSRFGGAIVCTQSPNNYLEMERCVFENNDVHASSNTTSVLTSRGRLIARNCLFVGNKKNSPFRLSTTSTQGADFINCAFVNNTPGGGGELFTLNNGGTDSYTPDGPLRFSNCIFQDNMPSSSSQKHLFRLFNGTVEASHCLVNENGISDCQTMLKVGFSDPGSATGEIYCDEGMLYDTPAWFVNPSQGDYRLNPCSVLRNAGTNAPWDSQAPPLTDLQGAERIAEGVADIGPYEIGAVSIAAASVQDVSCPGGSDGSVWLQAANACPTVLFTANGAPLPAAIAGGLAPGAHLFTATDALGRTDTLVFTLGPGPLPLSAEAQILDASGSAAADGQIWLDSLWGGTPPYELLWSNGATGGELQDLPPGIYALTLTDANGFQGVFEWEVGFVSSLRELSAPAHIEVWPNPASEVLWARFQLEAPGQADLRLYDMAGRQLWAREETCAAGAHVWQIPLEGLPPGLYHALFNQEAFRFVKN